MILTCPACRTRYLVNDEAVTGARGRTVRCAGCGHSWQQLPEATEVPAVSADKPLSADLTRIEPELDAPPRPASTSAPPAPARRGFRWVGLGWIALIVVLVAVILVGILARNEVVAMWPPAGKLYGFAGLAVEPLGAGLDIGKITPTRTPGGLIIAGEVTNVSKTVRVVPRLRIVLRDSAQKELQFKIIDPPKDRLLPGEVAHFETPFKQPNDAATGVAVTFAPG